MKPHQQAALQRLLDSLVEIDSYSEVPTDDAYITLDDNGVLTQVSDEVGAMLTLGHLRDIISVFTEFDA